MNIISKDYSFSTYENVSEKLTFLDTCAYQGVRNVSFSEKIAYVLNGWSDEGLQKRVAQMNEITIEYM